MTGFPDDPSERPTRMAGYDVAGSSQQDLEGEPRATPDGAEPDSAPQPWYRSRVLLAGWTLMVALLVALIIYGIVELSRGGGTSTPAPDSSTTPTQSSTTSTSSATTTPSTTAEAPAPGSPEQTPEEAPPPANNSPAPAEPPHHHHLHVPSTITLPHTVITVPHGF